MPKSKRNKVVTLTKSKKVDREQKGQLVEDIRACASEYSTCFVFTYANMRTNKMDGLRAKFRSGRFFLGRNKVMGLAIGRTPETECMDDIHRVTPYLRQSCGLFFTNDPAEHVQKFFKEYSSIDFARAGCMADRDVVIPAGPLVGFQHTMQPYMHDLGMPVELKNAVVTNMREHVICREGQELNPAQAKLLKLFDEKMAAFALTLEVQWCDGEVTPLSDYQPTGDDDDDDEEVPMMTGGFSAGGDGAQEIQLNFGAGGQLMPDPLDAMGDDEEEDKNARRSSRRTKKKK